MKVEVALIGDVEKIIKVIFSEFQKTNPINNVNNIKKSLINLIMHHGPPPGATAGDVGGQRRVRAAFWGQFYSLSKWSEVSTCPTALNTH